MKASAIVPLTDAVRLEHSRRPSPLEEEVTALFGELRDPLLRYLRSIGLPFQDGEEVIQEVFLSLFLHLNRGKSRANLRGWVFRVAHNLGLRRRTRNHRAAVAQRDEEAAERRPDPSPDPEERLVDIQRRNRLNAVVRALSEQDRRCLYLRAEGLRYREIAHVLGMSLGAVALSLGRSFARLSNGDTR
jgi:RNA polymerase sigma-70 factor (ECF subfamily)